MTILNVTMTEDAGYVPEYAHAGDAGLDLRAVEDYMIPSGKSAMVRTGLRVEIPDGYVGLEFPRSGLGSRGITMRNAVGVIDSGFRGEVMCPLWNTTDKPFHVKAGDRVCQLVVMPYERCEVVEREELSETERGTDGYGSTGVRQMPTDDERRRVARNIRDNFICGGLGYKIASAYNIAMAIGMVPEVLVGDIALWNRLADLIDPDTTSDRTKEQESSPSASPCDREALLALAGKIDHYADLRKSIGMDVETMVARAWADRIREACGVVS